ncbi:nucleotide exchange factor GrpE [Prosthecomicrobium pneumaticum]|uniref:nucleotide exchange factor GrpE n=1 Tax=Prosthecomicrobium pneumaticum TaxID=81895 RepID=UPI0016134335
MILALPGGGSIGGLGRIFDRWRRQRLLSTPRRGANRNDVAEGTVVEVLQPGYLLHDRLVRPAIVAVAAADNRSSDHPKT